MKALFGNKVLLKGKNFFLIVFGCFVVGCATEENYKKVLNTWVGRSVNELTSSWGYPVHTLKAPNGNNVYMFSNSRQVLLPSYTSPSTSYVNINPSGNTATVTTYPGNTTGGGVATISCTTWFEVNNSGLITTWRFQGNGCKANDPALKK